jgi:hypothetical protein
MGDDAMPEVSTLALYLLFWVLLLVYCRRVLVSMVGAQVIRRLEQTLKLLGRSVLWLALLPLRFAWNLTRLHFRRGRPSLAVGAARVADLPVMQRRGGHDLFASHRRRRRQT